MNINQYSKYWDYIYGGILSHYYSKKYADDPEITKKNRQNLAVGRIQPTTFQEKYDCLNAINSLNLSQLFHPPLETFTIIYSPVLDTCPVVIDGVY